MIRSESRIPRKAPHINITNAITKHRLETFDEIVTLSPKRDERLFSTQFMNNLANPILIGAFRAPLPNALTEEGSHFKAVICITHERSGVNTRKLNITTRTAQDRMRVSMSSLIMPLNPIEKAMSKAIGTETR